MSDLGFILDRRATQQIIAALSVGQMSAQVEPSGFAPQFEQPIFVNDSIAENPTWAGSKVDASVVATELHADSPAFWGADGDAFWGASAEVFWEPFLVWSYTYTFTPSTGASGNTLRVSNDDYGAPDLTIEWREDGVGTWNAYDDAAGIPTSAGHDYEIRVSGASLAGENGLVTLTSYIAVPAKVEHVYAQNIAAGTGTRLPLSLTYAAITSVVLETLPYSSAVRSEAVDLDETLGPLVKSYDAFNNSVFGVVNAVVYGY